MCRSGIVRKPMSCMPCLTPMIMYGTKFVVDPLSSMAPDTPDCGAKDVPMPFWLQRRIRVEFRFDGEPIVLPPDLFAVLPARIVPMSPWFDVNCFHESMPGST